ncbi:uncharacterized protein CTRU02_202606 [Colletotrichum truncatum]|uniref:Uncharacterized protein n=1 Tax=Colletotrichum truncatum TaxID=5467 RepID=A0ACC3ZKR5_COLTU
MDLIRSSVQMSVAPLNLISYLASSSFSEGWSRVEPWVRKSRVGVCAFYCRHKTTSALVQSLFCPLCSGLSLGNLRLRFQACQASSC